MNIKRHQELWESEKKKVLNQLYYLDMHESFLITMMTKKIKLLQYII